MERFRSEIEGFISATECPKGFSCCGSGFENICKAKDIGLDASIVCLEDPDPLSKCKFSVPFGGIHFCQCSVRIYIAKKLNR